MNRLRVVLLCYWLFFLSLSVKSQSDDLSTKSISLFPVPTFGHSPETSTYVGAVVLADGNLFGDTITRPSNAKLEFTYTWNKQLIFSLGGNIFSRHEKWFCQFNASYSKYPDRYYGVGGLSDQSDEIEFDSRRVAVETESYKRITKSDFVGTVFRFIDYSKVLDPTFTYIELEDSQTLGIGAAYLIDSRNSLLNPTDGLYLKLSNVHNWGLNYYNTSVLDWRRYLEIGNGNILAMRFYQSAIFGTPNFYDYSILGGDQITRGYFYGRFRDNHLSTYQVEFRKIVFWRLGFAVFGGISSVYEEFASLFDQDFMRPNLGLGLRFVIDRQTGTNLRFDYAIGNSSQNGFYVAFGESF